MKNLFKLALIIASLTSLNACIVAAGAAAGEGAATYAQDRSVGSKVDDNAIALSINKKFLEKDDSLFTNVDTEVHEGRVLLAGKVADPNPQRRGRAGLAGWRRERSYQRNCYQQPGNFQQLHD